LERARRVETTGAPVLRFRPLRRTLCRMPIDLLAILAVVVIALAIGLWRTRDARAAARERERNET
jgi:hypothetical protein